MNLQTLLGLYRNNAHLQQLVKDISIAENPYKALIHNVKGSSINFVAAGIWHATQHKDQNGFNHVFILNDKEEAAYFHNDLEQLTNKPEVSFFPDSYKKSGFYHEVNKSNLMLRTEALSKFAVGNNKVKSGGVIVTYPEAMFEKVIDPKAFSEQVIQIVINESLAIDELLDKLVKLGFKRADFVYEPGQFAMRGGILDIYSFGNEHPFRIELFGDQVDSIRIFNPESQLSERKLIQVSILPNIESSFVHHEKISFHDYLPANTVFWFKDVEFTYEKLNQLEEELLDKIGKAQLYLKEKDEINDGEIPTVFDFIRVEHWKSQILKSHVIEWSSSDSDWVKQHPFHSVLFQHAQKFVFKTEAQPAFNRNFDLLIKDFKLRTKEGYQIYLFAENSKQLERVHSILEDQQAAVNFVPIPQPLSEGFIDHEIKMVVYTDHQIFQRYHKYKIKQAYSKDKAITLKALRELQAGDYVTHIDHGIGVYSGLQKIDVNGSLQEAVRIIYRDNDVLYVNINSLHKIAKYSGKEGSVPKINKLGSEAWEKLKNKTKKQVKDIAEDLIKLYAKRKASTGFAHSKDSYLQTELEASFIYEDTPDQSKATADVKRDMESPSPMDRLVCGDVGFGKTEIAIRAAFKTVADSKQAAILVPTTILAFQHYKTFLKRLKNFPCNIDYINRFKSAKQKKETLQRVKEGKVDILIGTHSILGKDVIFKDLGLLIVDEEQKFGVGAKEKLREKKANVDTLTLTATPIPRTLQFSLMNARDLSIINTPPPNRQPVQTELIGFNEEVIRDAIYFEVQRGGQVYFIHNRVQSLPGMADMIKALCPDLEIAMAHGQLEGNQLEKTLLDFIDHKYDVLCCTNIVESGVDIANANTIIINNAHQFGLSDLHQLRGRVGRSNKKAFCYLLAPSLITLPNDSRRRLQTLEQFNDLGSGFQIAMRDLDIRGAGNLLGGEQSGFIAEIGIEMYQKILNEAIHELKSTDFGEVFAEEMERKHDFVTDCTIDTDLEILIPDEYVENIGERLVLYTQLDNLEEEDKLQQFKLDMIDRFGPMPVQTEALFTTIHCRWLAKRLGFEKLILKNKQLRLYFINNPESKYFESPVFHHIMRYIQTDLNNAQLKQVGKNFLLTIKNVKDMDEVKWYLDNMMID